MILDVLTVNADSFRKGLETAKAQIKELDAYAARQRLVNYPVLLPPTPHYTLREQLETVGRNYE